MLYHRITEILLMFYDITKIDLRTGIYIVY